MDVDWNRIYTKRLSARCLQAARDLGLAVHSPFELEAEGRKIEFVALFPAFGGSKGTLVTLSSQWDDFHELAGRAGYTCVGLYPEQFALYDRGQWEGIISQWEKS
jgi:hypothetical protein